MMSRIQMSRATLHPPSLQEQQSLIDPTLVVLVPRRHASPGNSRLLHMSCSYEDQTRLWRLCHSYGSKLVLLQCGRPPMPPSSITSCLRPSRVGHGICCLLCSICPILLLWLLCLQRSLLAQWVVSIWQTVLHLWPRWVLQSLLLPSLVSCLLLLILSALGIQF
jgi:hypothetical protein